MKRIKFFIGAVLLVAVTMFAAGCEEDNAEPTNVSDNTATDYWVDLGLPSGLLWATRNVGASSPEDYGDYFAWGETQPKDYYSWGTYRYGKGSTTLTKYCSSSFDGIHGFTDDLITLLSSDDAAAVNVLGSRMPTLDEWRELYYNTTSQWTSINGVHGRIFTAPNGKSLFLPAAGYNRDGYTDYVGLQGLYWSSSRNEVTSYNACYFSSCWNYAYWGDGSYRYHGYSVRPVRSAH